MITGRYGDMEQISIHALREEGDSSEHPAAAFWSNFYPRPPRGGRPTSTLWSSSCSRYFYPRPPRGGRRIQDRPETPKGGISIHALREEGDGNKLLGGGEAGKISIHALREEGDILMGNPAIYDGKFLSTPSARRATGSAAQGCPQS